ncbi:MAG: isoaspartyl peptidase/L-asparaginase [Halorientalis sp.]
MRIVVHGGAMGRPDEPAVRRAALEEAAATGAAAATPLDAVERALRELEAAPRFNAGVGSARQVDGVARTDAGVMTDDRAVGAACAMPGVEHAVSAARVVRDETPHVLVAGDGAVALADAYGVETGVDLRTDRTRERWADADPPERVRERVRWAAERFGRGDGGVDGDATDHDTVGAVATDGEGFAAATSTGGRWFALPGRVGDVPQTGAGFYCAPAGAASATGAGEDIARATLARRAVGHLEAGRDASTAAERAVAEFAELTGSGAGVVVLGADGRGTAHNTPSMQTAARR